MTSGPLTYWLEQLVLIMLLVGVILLLPLLPARAFFSVYWPHPVEELILRDGDQALRKLLPVGAGENPAWDVVARSRPHSVVSIETRGGDVVHAYLIGRREQDNELDPASDNDTGPSVLLIQLADDSRLELEIAAVHRLMHSNRLKLVERARMTGARLIEAWSQRPSESAAEVDAIEPEQGHEQPVDAEGDAGTVG
ncbi:MAG: hypothetical protein JJU31_00020 [Wenzhouxiangella sp.]|nr:hypothetical protein [Wenzhouxiangella sp.]TVR94794.1 MAG: hypothetical protein EA418_09160 [Wenzhouxiangellaceae bacterium]